LLPVLVAQDLQKGWDQARQVLGDLLAQTVSDIDDDSDSQSRGILIIRLLERVVNILTELANGNALF